MDLMTATPKLTGDVQKDIKNLTDHIFQLEEYLRYQLRNLDVTNFNDLGLARYENGRLQVYAKAVEVHTKDLEVRLENTEKTVSFLDETAGRLQSEVATIKATSEEIRTEVSTVETNLGKQIGSLQDQQQENYLYLDGKIDTKVTELNSTISQTAKEIRSEVSASLESVNGEIEDVRSSITQTAGDIRLEVGESLTKIDTDLKTLESGIDENHDSISKLLDDYDTMSSELSLTSNSISAVVSAVGQNGAVTAASIVAAINEAGSEVKIAADHVTVDASSFAVDGVISGIEIGTAYKGALSGNIVIKEESIEFQDTDPTESTYNRKTISVICASYDDGENASAGLDIITRNVLSLIGQKGVEIVAYSGKYNNVYTFEEDGLYSREEMKLSCKNGFVGIGSGDGGYWSIEDDGFYKVDKYGERVLYIQGWPM